MYDLVYSESLKKAKHKVWIFSDLQQSDPANAEECMRINMKDFYDLGAPADMIWYLGDTVEGKDHDRLLKMCKMQEEAFVKTGLPVCYVAGNHDLDYIRHGGGDRVMFYETVKRHPEWYCAKDMTSPYYKVKLGNYMIYFLTDHIAPDISWSTTHGIIHGDAEKYPHIGLLKSLKHEMEADGCPIITASHYSFAGGSRPSELFDNILPLPQNVKLHFYAHAHFGDFAWAGPNPYQRISWTEMHDIPQINVSSFEHFRGPISRSVFLHIYEDDSCGIFFRNHDSGTFTECYLPAKINFPHGEKKQ